MYIATKLIVLGIYILAYELIGLKRVSYSAARSVLDAMPYEMREELNVDSQGKFKRPVKKARTEVLEGVKMEIN